MRISKLAWSAGAAVVIAIACSGGSPTGSSSQQYPCPTPAGVSATMVSVQAALTANPPSTTGGNAARRAALSSLSDVMWKVCVAGPPGAEISAFYKTQMDKVAAEMAQPVTDGVRIWALYNAGFIVKSPGKTVAFDLSDGRPGLPSDLPPGYKLFGYNLPASIVNQIDVLMISHEHLDHTGYGGDIAGRVKANGGAVLYPRLGAAFANATQLVDSGATYTISGVTIKPRKQPHGTVQNMAYEVTLPSGYKIVHFDGEYSIIDDIKNVDVLFLNVWISGSTGICKDAFIRSMNIMKPGITIPSHMQEMSHDTTGGAGRCGSNRYNYSYPLEIQDDATVTQKFAMMTWGESITFKH